MVDKSEIRRVFEDWEKTSASKNKKSIFGNPNAVAAVRNDNTCDGEHGIEQSLENMTEHLDEDKPGGKKSKNPKKKVGKATTTAPQSSKSTNNISSGGKKGGKSK